MSLIDPTVLSAPTQWRPNDKDGLVPLDRVLRDLQVLSNHQLDAIGDHLCKAQQDVHPPFAEKTRDWLQQAKEDGDLALQLLLAALRLRELTTYALRPNTDSLYAVQGSWWVSTGLLFEREASIRRGVWVVNRALFQEQTPEWEVAYRPLYVKKRRRTNFCCITRPAKHSCVVKLKQSAPFRLRTQARTKE